MLKLTYSRKVILAFFIFIITLFTLTGCAKKDNKQDIEKVKDEICFLDETIITMMNRANNISFNNYKVISENVKQEKTGSTHRTKW